MEKPVKLPGVAVALSMCSETSSEATLPTPMCWDLALYVARLEAYAERLSSQSGRTAEGAAPYQGPAKLTPEEVAQGNVAIRWVTETQVAGRPTLHDVLDYIERRGDAIHCGCERCKTFLAATPKGIPAAPQADRGAWHGLTAGEIDHAVGSLVDYGTDFVAPLYAVVEGIERTLRDRNAATPVGIPADTEAKNG